MIEVLQNSKRVLWNHILVNLPNFKSADAKVKSYAQISCVRLITIPGKKKEILMSKNDFKFSLLDKLHLITRKL